MGVVYKATDTELNRPVALKFLSSHLLRDEEGPKRFRREAQAAAALDHPNICPVYSVHQEGRENFIAMAFVDGPTLAERIQEAPFDFEQAIDVAVQIAEGLEAAHDKGVVHRDIKPQNIMLPAKGPIRIMDFGLARLMNRGKITRSGMLLGTPPYMSPEQIDGADVDPRTDIWSLGVLLYEMLAQRTPFEHEYDQAVAYSILNEQPEPITSLRYDLPAGIDNVLARLLAKRRTDRYQSAEHVAAELNRLRREEPQYQPPRVRNRPQRRGLVGRDEELLAMREALTHARDDSGLVLEVMGEAGIGKTTLVQAFLADVERSPTPWLVASGRCSQSLSSSDEAYLPFFEALSTLLGQSQEVQELMRAHAPWWFAEAASTAGRRPTQDRVRRELSSFLREASQSAPVLLFIEDLHWADLSTIDLIAHLGARLDDMRLLIVATYRPSQMRRAKHPYRSVQSGLETQGRRREIELRFLSEQDIADFLAGEYPDSVFPSEFTAMIHGRTEGNPLFMTDLVRNLEERRVIAHEENGWRLVQPVSDIKLELPDSTRGMIQRKIDDLGDRDRLLLDVAGVQGADFDLWVLNHVLQREKHWEESVEGIEERLQKLASDHHFVERLPRRRSSDPASRLRYRFVHVLYRDEIYDSLPFTKQARLKSAVAEALKALRPEVAKALAAEGRSREAADAYSLAAREAESALRFDLRRSALEEYLKCGQLTEGFSLLEDLCGEVGLWFPGRWKWLRDCAAVWGRFRVWFSGFEFEDQTRPVAPRELNQVKLCWSAALGLGLIDPSLSTHFHARFFALARASGQRLFFANAVAGEVAIASIPGGARSRRRCLKAYDLARKWAAGDAKTEAFCESMRGTMEWLHGDWKKALESSEHALELLDMLPSVSYWETVSAQIRAIGSYAMMGEFGQVRRLFPPLLAAAKEREDTYAQVGLHLMSYRYLATLADDDPEQAETEISDALAKWPSQGFDIQQCDELFGRIDIALYREDGAGTLQRIDHVRKQLSSSGLLEAHLPRTFFNAMWGRAALAAAQTSNDRERRKLVQLASNRAKAIRKERMPWCLGWALLLEAGAAPDRSRAIDRLVVAEAALTKAHMPQYAAAAWRRRGELTGDNFLVAKADDWLHAHGVCRPMRFANMLAPGPHGN